MKTLKQIREEYNDKFLSKVESNLPDELMLEGRDTSKSVHIPSSKKMPVMLVFRRVQYRIFPNNQVVALYYSKMVNKYLSIPFGPDGNLNLSESVILEEEQLDEILPALPAIGAAVTGAAVRGLAAAGATNVAKQIGRAGIRKVAGAYAKRGLRSLGQSALKRAVSGSDSSGNNEKKPTASEILAADSKRDTIKHQSDVVKKSSWDIGSDRSLDTRKSQMKTADLARARAATTPQKQVQENKMSDLRKMIDEGVEVKTLTINERQVDINIGMAKRILEVYDSVNAKNKKIVESMLNEDLESFKKLLNFSIKA
jgi:hypothetical protein